MGLILLFFGVVLIIIGAAFIALIRITKRNHTEVEARCTVSTEAQLVDHVRKSVRWTDEIEVTYHGIYEYLTKDGVQVRSENENGYGRPENISGPTVTLVYNPAEPTEFFIPSEQASIAETLPGLERVGPILLAIGIPLLVAAALLWGA